MRKIAIVILLFLSACKSKDEKTKEEAQDRVNKIAAPAIANIIGNFNLLVETAKNQNLPFEDRSKAISDLRENFCEFMCEAANPDSVYTEHFNEAVRKEREFIEAKCREAAAKQIYIQSLQKQYESKN